jgi:hypothetical protein
MSEAVAVALLAALAAAGLMLLTAACLGAYLRHLERRHGFDRHVAETTRMLADRPAGPEDQPVVMDRISRHAEHLRRQGEQQ